MSEDTLAQDEIDALLQAANISETPDAGAAQKELADEVAGEFFNSISAIFLALLGNDVTIEKVESGSIPIDMLTQDITEPVAVAFVDSNKGLNSVAVLLFNEKNMTVVTDLILMGEGEEKEKFTDDDMDALKEAVNQTMGNLGQNMTAKYGETVSFEQADIKVLEPADSIAFVKEKLKEDSFHNTLFSLKVADKLETQFRLLLPLSIEDEIARLEQKATASGALEPAAETAGQAEGSTAGGPADISNLDMILDLKVEITVKLGETIKPLRDIIQLTRDNILPLDKASEAPVDVIVNNKTIARGELIVIPPYHFAIKVTEVKDRLDRIKNISLH
jgi:flagellar motor switch protein FliN/FliY